MSNITTLNLSSEIVEKLKAKNVDSFTKVESKVVETILNGESLITESSVSVLSFIAPIVMKLEKVKNLKASRKARMVVVVENKESIDTIAKEIKSLLTKELVIVNLKKNKTTIEGPVDIVVGTSKRLLELVESKALKMKNVKHVVMANLKNLDVDELTKLLCRAKKNDADSSVDDAEEGKGVKLVITTSQFDSSVKSFLNKHSNLNIKKIKNEAEESSDEENDNDSEDNVVINKESQEQMNESDDAENEKSKEDNSYEIDEELLNNMRQAKEDEKNTNMAKLMIEEFTDVGAICRLISLIKPAEKKVAKTSAPVFTSGSKLTGRDGYTAYHLVTNQEVFGKGYLFKSLKRLIDEETVEKIENVRLTKDMRGFVFDLQSDLDETFQGSWRDGKYDTMTLLTDMPELSDAPERGSFGGRGNDRGGRGGRGNFRGGRGNDRGGRGGRGFDRGGRGRGGDRGGLKRPGNSDFDSKSKLQKFD